MVVCLKLSLSQILKKTTGNNCAMFMLDSAMYQIAETLNPFVLLQKIARADDERPTGYNHF